MIKLIYKKKEQKYLDKLMNNIIKSNKLINKNYLLTSNSEPLEDQKPTTIKTDFNPFN